MIATAAPIRHRLIEQFRCHPDIAQFLSGRFHGGEWRIRTETSALRRAFPGACLGMHWHGLDDGASPATIATRIAGLITIWQEAGLFDDATGATVGVVAPVPALLSLLAAELDRLIPPGPVRRRMAVALPERFRTQCIDLLVLVPGVSAALSSARNRHLAANRALYHDAVGAARAGLHVLGEVEACRAAGGHAAALLEHAQRAAAVPASAAAAPDRPRDRLAALLTAAGLTVCPVAGGFHVYTGLGGAYRVLLTDAESALQAEEDQAWIPVLVDPDEVMTSPERLQQRLERLA